VAVIPFIFAYVLGMIVLALFPDLTLFLPNWAYGPPK
jgi:C4-dicarboxylate transporter DctM subunit